MTNDDQGPGNLRGLVRSGPPEGRLYLRPTGLVPCPAGPTAGSPLLPLAGGPLAFGLVELLVRRDDGGGAHSAILPAGGIASNAAGDNPAVAAHLRRLVGRVTASRPAWAGLAGDRPLVMGVVNVTPDSFSDGGDLADPAAAIARGRALAEAGADILDIGGESTRPGADPVAPEEEQARILPVIEGLRDCAAVLSIDTRRASVMAAALGAGAGIVNDITALNGDPDSLATVAVAGCAVILMHMHGEPRTMQDRPHYDCAPLDVFDGLAERVAACEAAGIPCERIAVDPGIGFGKTAGHNLEILARLSLLHGLGCTLAVGVSRKAFIGRLGGNTAPKDRLPGSLGAGLAALAQGARILRVHDVAETAQAVALWQASLLG